MKRTTHDKGREARGAAIVLSCRWLYVHCSGEWRTAKWRHPYSRASGLGLGVDAAACARALELLVNPEKRWLSIG